MDKSKTAHQLNTAQIKYSNCTNRQFCLREKNIIIFFIYTDIAEALVYSLLVTKPWNISADVYSQRKRIPASNT